MKFTDVKTKKFALSAERLNELLDKSNMAIICSPSELSPETALKRLFKQASKHLPIPPLFITATQGGNALGRLVAIRKAISNPNRMVFIEMPETFLHPATQEDLSRILSTHNGKVIVFTHSPVFIGNKWSSVIDLYDDKSKDYMHPYLAERAGLR